MPIAYDIINNVNPDIVHVFGVEWPFGLVIEKCSIPVVIHIQGSLVSYNNAYYPPGYNLGTMVCTANLNFRIYWQLWKSWKIRMTNLAIEKKIWKVVKLYMGRTIWDKALFDVLTTDSQYYHVDEALRPIFYKTKKKMVTD